MKPIFAFKAVPDGGVLTLGSPQDTVFTDSTYPVQATLRNFGTVPITFDAIATINGYTDTISVINLLPNTSRPVNFQTWQVPPPDSTSYTMTVCTEVPLDSDTTNDCQTKPIFAYTYRFEDIGVTSLPMPQDTVFTDSTYTSEAWIRNFGNLTSSSIEVVATLNGYTDTVIVASLSPRDSNLVTFQNWTVPSPDSTTYIYSVCTDVFGDEDTTNNCGAKSIFAYTPVGVEESVVSDRLSVFRLEQNHPNPFHSTTLIRYTIPVVRGKGSGVSGEEKIPVRLEVYDITGRLVETLVDERQAPGVYQLPITSHKFPASGIYFFRLTAGDYTSTIKMTLLH